MTTLNIYVPYDNNSPASRVIKGGSAIVGDGMGEQFNLYFEGNLYGACNMELFAEKAMIAGGRLIDSYPTVARMICEPEALRQVGVFDTQTNEVTLLPGERGTLKSWTDLDERYIAFDEEFI
jgi:hypothetical protein